jgi:hypothetical protein
MHLATHCFRSCWFFKSKQVHGMNYIVFYPSIFPLTHLWSLQFIDNKQTTHETETLWHYEKKKCFAQVLQDIVVWNCIHKISNENENFVNYQHSNFYGNFIKKNRICPHPPYSYWVPIDAWIRVQFNGNCLLNINYNGNSWSSACITLLHDGVFHPTTIIAQH